MIPETKYAKTGDLSIAYQVIGNGERDLIYVPGIISHVEFFHPPGRARADNDGPPPYVVRRVGHYRPRRSAVDPRPWLPSVLISLSRRALCVITGCEG